MLPKPRIRFTVGLGPDLFPRAEKRVVLKIKRFKDTGELGLFMVGFFGAEPKELIQMMSGPTSEDYLLLLESLGAFFEKEIELPARQIALKAEFPREDHRRPFQPGSTSLRLPTGF